MVIPEPCLNIMAQVSLGLTPDFASFLIFNFLLRQKPVLGIQNQQFLNFPPCSLKSLIHKYTKILADWGLLWISQEELFAFIRNKLEPGYPDTEKIGNNAGTPSKRLIVTQEDVFRRIKKGEKQWLVPDNAIVTSLAWEIAEKHGFTIKKIKSPS